MAKALITGATSGIGHAFAVELASEGYDLVLVARDENRLKEVAGDLHGRYRVEAQVLPGDLGVREDVDKIQEFLRENPVEVLVNNAGFSLNEPLIGGDTDLQRRAMDVMATSVLLLTDAAGRSIVENGKGTIINIGSVSAWIIKGNYSAIKRWVVTYTQALADELADTGVQATVVCPGWVKTELHARAGVKRPKLPGWAWNEPRDVARAALKGAKAGKVLVVPKLQWRLAVWFLNHGPAALPRFVSRKIRSSRKAK